MKKRTRSVEIPKDRQQAVLTVDGRDVKLTNLQKPFWDEPLIRKGDLVWSFSKQFARYMASKHPRLITAEYRIAKRPAGRVLVDYNQNAWGRTLASVYSVRPKPRAPVSMPVGWDEIERGITLEQFRLDNARERLERVGDLWKPIIAARGRLDLSGFAAGGRKAA